MSPRRRTKRIPQSRNSGISRSRANAGSKPLIAGPATFKQVLTICMLPIWLVVIAAFDHAIADSHDPLFSVSIPVETTGLNQEQDFDEIDDALRTHWVNTDPDGNLTGRISEIDDELSRISPIEELEIVLLQQGKVQRKAEATDANGLFTLTDVKPGDYTLVASGPNGFLAYGVHVLTPLVPFDPDDASNIPPQRESIQYVSLFETSPIGVDDQDQFQIDAAAIPPKFRELERIVSNYLPTEEELSLGKNTDDLKPLEEALQIAGGFKFALNDDGSFSGRVLSPSGDGETVELADMNIFLLQEDIEIHRVDVEKNGAFRIEGVDPGVYAVVAAGKDGFAALSFELVNADQSLSTSAGEKSTMNEYYVSLPQDPAKSQFSISIIVDPEDLKYCRQKIKELNRNDENQNRQVADGFIESESGFPATSGVFPATSGGSPFPVGGSAGSGSFPAANGGLQRFLRGSAIAAAIVALGTIDGEPTVMSPVQP